jgi:uncharacterized protein YukE
MAAGINELDTMWDGQANDAFKAQFQKDEQLCETYCKALDDFIACLEYAAKEYENCENMVKQAVDAVRI